MFLPSWISFLLNGLRLNVKEIGDLVISYVTTMKFYEVMTSINSMQRSHDDAHKFM